MGWTLKRKEGDLLLKAGRAYAIATANATDTCVTARIRSIDTATGVKKKIPAKFIQCLQERGGIWPDSPDPLARAMRGELRCNTEHLGR
jgi:hypothetical protein